MMSSKLLLSAVIVATLVSSTIFVAISAIPRASAQQKVQGADWAYTNGDQRSTNYNPQTQINKDNVKFLELKWMYAFPQAPTTVGGFTTTAQGAGIMPLIIDGIVYQATNFCSIIALNADNGKLIWNWTPEMNITEANALIQQGIRFNSLTCDHMHSIAYFEGKIYGIYPPCMLYVVDGLTGKTIKKVGPLCKDVEGNIGRYKTHGSYPPVFYKGGRIMVVPGASTITGPIDQGRGVFFGYNVDTYQKLWTLYTCPRQDRDDPDWAAEMLRLRSENRLWLQGVAGKDVPEDLIRNDWGPRRVATRPTGFSGTCTGQGWSQYPVDEDTGIAYLTTNNVSPDFNGTYRPGPNLLSESFFAVDARTGKLLWAFQATSHSFWDWECSFSGPMGVVSGRKMVFKGCKNGRVHAVDAATGEPVWILDPPAIKRTKFAELNDPRSRESMTKPWANYPDKGPYIQNPPSTGGIESDMAFDGKTIYVATYNAPILQQILSVDLADARSSSSRPLTGIQSSNTTLYALDPATGKIKWEFFIAGEGYRGGLVVSGGVLYAASVDGNLYMIDADTGKLITNRFFGIKLTLPPAIGADGKGRVRVILPNGGSIAFGGVFPGATMAFGLPDQLPQPQVITKEVIKEVPKEVVKEVIREVPKEVIKEVPKEVIKEVPRDVIKEVPKEVTKTVTVETIGPVTYAAIGVAVVAIVVAGVALSRRKKV